MFSCSIARMPSRSLRLFDPRATGGPRHRTGRPGLLASIARWVVLARQIDSESLDGAPNRMAGASRSAVIATWCAPSDSSSQRKRGAHALEHDRVRHDGDRDVAEQLDELREARAPRARASCAAARARAGAPRAGPGGSAGVVGAGAGAVGRVARSDLVEELARVGRAHQPRHDGEVGEQPRRLRLREARGRARAAEAQVVRVQPRQRRELRAQERGDARLREDRDALGHAAGDVVAARRPAPPRAASSGGSSRWTRARAALARAQPSPPCASSTSSARSLRCTSVVSAAASAAARSRAVERGEPLAGELLGEARVRLDRDRAQRRAELHEREREPVAAARGLRDELVARAAGARARSVVPRLSTVAASPACTTTCRGRANAPAPGMPRASPRAAATSARSRAARPTA